DAGGFTLTDIPPGPATLELAGFAQLPAPGVDDVSATCATDPPLGQPCGAVGSAPPSFESSPADITIIPGQPVQGQDIGVLAFPFLINLQPGPGGSIPGPVVFTFTIADAVFQLDPNSISIEITPAGGAPIGPFTPTLRACDDTGATPCSDGGVLEVSGFH